MISWYLRFPLKSELPTLRKYFHTTESATYDETCVKSSSIFEKLNIIDSRETKGELNKSSKIENGWKNIWNVLNISIRLEKEKRKKKYFTGIRDYFQLNNNNNKIENNRKTLLCKYSRIFSIVHMENQIRHVQFTDKSEKSTSALHFFKPDFR